MADWSKLTNRGNVEDQVFNDKVKREGMRNKKVYVDFVKSSLIFPKWKPTI